MTSAEADSITDYTSLELRLEASCFSGTCNAGGSRDSVSVSWAQFSVLDNPPLPIPTIDTVTVLNSTSLQIDFTEPVDTSNILSYNIERNSGTGFTVIGNVVVGTSIFDDIDLIADTFYNYRIISVGASENSNPSNIVGARTTVILFAAHPDSDPGVRWVNGLGLPPCSDLLTFNCVNEDLRNDNDFIQTIGLGSSGSDVQLYTLSDIEDPLRSDSHFLRYTLREANVGTNPVAFEIELRQGGTTIATFTHPSGTLSKVNYELFSQELTGTQSDSITDYSQLELTLTASCPVSCTNQEREKVHVSWIVFEIQQVSSPSIDSLDTLSSTSIRVSWLLEDVDAEITDIIIQRINGTDFISVGNVTSSITTFDDTTLTEQQIIDYRLKGMLVGGGFSSASETLIGSTPPSSATINTDGVVIEPNPTNTISTLNRQVFSQTVEHFNVTSTSLAIIITDIETNEFNLYQIIDKMNNGTYDNTQQMRNAGSFYANKYLIFADVNNFLNNITFDVIDSLGGSNGTGDNPNFGLPREAEQ